MKNYWTFIKESRDYQEIHYICRRHEIENYIINEDGSVDVDGGVNFFKRRLKELPLKFGTVTGGFMCPNNNLTSLKGAPHTVGGDFYCHYNKLTSLKGCPKKVGGDFYFFKNELTSFKGGPSSVGGSFNCRDNNLTSFKGFPESHRNDISVNLLGNPVEDVYKLFNNIKAINPLNEWDVIDPDDMTVSYGALCEVYNDLILEAPPLEDINFENYTLVD